MYRSAGGELWLRNKESCCQVASINGKLGSV